LNQSPHFVSLALVCDSCGLVHENGDSSKCSDTIGIKTSLSIKIVSFNFGKCFFDKRSPQILEIIAWLGEFHCWIAGSHEEHFFINGDNPRFTTNIEFDSMNLLVILGLSDEHFFDQFWKFTNAP